MKDLHRYVIKTAHAPNWRYIGIELNLETSILDIIAKDNPFNATVCFEKTLDKWLNLNPNATWSELEVAITNVRRANLARGLDPVTDIYGKYRVICCISHSVLFLLIGPDP